MLKLIRKVDDCILKSVAFVYQVTYVSMPAYSMPQTLRWELLGSWHTGGHFHCKHFTVCADECGASISMLHDERRLVRRVQSRAP